MTSRFNKINSLTSLEQQCLLGTLLGDGSIGFQPKGKTPRFQMRHSIKQKQWFFYKVNTLKRLATEKAVHTQKPDGFSKNEKLHFQTRSLSVLTPIYNLVTRNNVKTVSNEWLNQINPFGLMVWWLDDGSLIGSGRRKGRFNVQGFGKDGCELIVTFLTTKYGVSASVEDYQQNGKIYYYIYIQPLSLRRLLRLMMPHVPCADMLYKFFLVFKNKQLQQNWITDMKTALPQFSSEIDELAKYYSK